MRAASILLVGACGGGEPRDPIDPVEARLATMDAHELAAQTLAAAVRLRDGAVDATLLAEIATGAAGAVLVAGNDPTAARAAVARLRAAAPHPLLVILDLEAPADPMGAPASPDASSVAPETSGPDSAAPSGVHHDSPAAPAAEGSPPRVAPALPPARLLAALGDPALLRRAGEETALRAHGLGAQVGLVSLPPLNGSSPLPAVARDPDRIAAGLAAFAGAAEAGGLSIAVRALWTADDSAGALRWDRARLEALELAELGTLLGEGVAAVVLGPVRLPALTGDTLPLKLSPAGPGGLLRRDLAFDGVVMADLSRDTSLAGAPDPVDAAVAALAAGIDLLLGVERPAAMVDGVAAAVAAGRLSPERLKDAARRVLRLQQRLAAADSARAEAGAARPARVPDLSLDTLATVRTAARIAAARATAEADSLALAFAPRATADSAGMQGLWPPAPTLEEASAASVDMRATLGASIDAIMRKALEDSVFSGAAVAIGRRGRLVLLRGYGREGREGGGQRVDPRETIFDVASLTKVVGTTTAVALLVEEGSMELDAPLERYLPRFDGKGKDDVLIRHLLTHTSGLPSGLWLFGSAGSSEEALRQVLRQDLLREPGEGMEYSDLGMILLAEAAEEAA
ncbi:MAG TPA: serine hydrolase, partial [Longimicrobiaceae bacterium]